MTYTNQEIIESYIFKMLDIVIRCVSDNIDDNTRSFTYNKHLYIPFDYNRPVSPDNRMMRLDVTCKLSYLR